MKACTMANGSVFFVPDEIERKTKSVSYKDLLAADKAAKRSEKKLSLFDRLMKRDRISNTQTKAA